MSLRVPPFGKRVCVYLTKEKMIMLMLMLMAIIIIINR